MCSAAGGASRCFLRPSWPSTSVQPWQKSLAFRLSPLFGPCSRSIPSPPLTIALRELKSRRDCSRWAVASSALQTGPDSVADECAAVPAAPQPCPAPVAFFDVDGTILKSNVVSAFLSLKLPRMSLPEKAVWVPYFALNVLLYLALDRINRALFNRVFYRNYRGIPAQDKASLGAELHSNYVLPRLLPGAVACIKGLQAQGFQIVLVTGSLDFLIAPLAEALQCDAVFAAKLKEKGGRLSGELEGEAVSAEEKAQLVKQYATRVGADLASCHAYGDSVADLAMLQAVGLPHVVNPEARLRSIALEKGWPILEWHTAKPAAIRAATAP